MKSNFIIQHNLLKQLGVAFFQFTFVKSLRNSIILLEINQKKLRYLPSIVVLKQQLDVQMDTCKDVLHFVDSFNIFCNLLLNYFPCRLEYQTKKTYFQNARPIMEKITPEAGEEGFYSTLLLRNGSGHPKKLCILKSNVDSSFA